MIRRGGKSRRQRGQGLVEFALVLPIFTAVLLGMIEVGRVVWANNAVANAAREGARYAAVHGGTKSNSCPVGPEAEETIIPTASADCPFPSPSKQGVQNEAMRYVIAGGSGTVITVCYGSGCSGDADTAGATNARGTPVTVRVTSQVSMLVSFLGIGPFTVSGTSTMLVNH
ncbi:MAG TPA: TadE/TadG family type IV pilus assembly protein [Candidatus Limnocylindrales bacterium]|nr:TadE/TadG family type IV pilus assembly protein [Candidatus Limnocylindrales bacterium]